MPLRILADGPILKILRWVPAAEERDLQDGFFSCPRVTPADKKKITIALRIYTESGYPKSREKFKLLEDDIYEMKPTAQLRLLGIKISGSFVVLLCVRKKRNDLRSQDIAKAQRLREAYYEEDEK